MNERAAHLVDCVFPHVPVRQWVLTVPHGLRFKMAYDPELTRGVHRIFIRAVSSHLRRKVRRLGIRNTVKTGAVTVIQRFDSALALNVHFHALVLDGVYAMDELGRPQFHPTPGPSDVEVARVAQTVFRKVYDALEDNESGPTEDDAVMAVLASASIERKVTVGPRRGFPLRRLRAGRQPEGRVLGRRCAEVEGFNVHANTRVAANQRRELEALCRYIARPPVSDDRLEWTSDRNVALRLKRPWSDGTTHLLFSPEELIEKLIPLVPRPRCHLTLFSGVLAPAAGWRPLIVPGPRPEGLGGSGARDGPDRSGPTDRLRNWISWADLLRRVFLVDALECPKVQGANADRRSGD